MIIKSLKINNLRNVGSIEIKPGPALNLFYGDNGAGKTTIIESLVVLAKGRSFRSSSAQSLIGNSGESFNIFAELTGGQGKVHALGLERASGHWKARIDGKDASLLSDLAEYIPLILMEPNSHQLVSGPPDTRRRYLDWGVFHVKHDFLSAWRHYARAIKQRNAALRMKNSRMVSSLDPQAVELGIKIHEMRQAQVGVLQPLFTETLSHLSPALGTVRLQYSPGWRHESLQVSLAETLESDMDRGYTSCGPHRADLVIKVNERSAKDRLSRGEQKILSASLLLSQARHLADSGVNPVLLLDDLASEFDCDHLERVVHFAHELGVQIFFTGTTIEPYRFLKEKTAVMFHVKHGAIETATVQLDDR